MERLERSDPVGHVAGVAVAEQHRAPGVSMRDVPGGERQAVVRAQRHLLKSQARVGRHGPVVLGGKVNQPRLQREDHDTNHQISHQRRDESDPHEAADRPPRSRPPCLGQARLPAGPYRVRALKRIHQADSCGHPAAASAAGQDEGMEGRTPGLESSRPVGYHNLLTDEISCRRTG